MLAAVATGSFLANQKSGIPVSATDLINGLVPLPSETNYIRSFEGGPISNLTDGRTAATASTNEFSAQQNAVFSLDAGTGGPPHGAFWYATYRLPLGTAAAGYDITSIDSVTGHQDARSDQTIDIEVQFVGDNNFYSLSNNATFAHRPGTGDGAGKIHIEDSTGGPLARGVRAIRFEADQQAVFRELDVFGAPTPLPTAAPAAPTNPVATLQGTDVVLTFTDQANNEAGFRVERALVTGGVPGAFETVAGLPANNIPGPSGVGGTVTYRDNRTLVGQTYQYRIVAFNAFNGGTSSTPITVNATTPTGTPAVNGLSARYFGATRWRGLPIATQIDPNLSDNVFLNQSPHPSVPVDQFSAVYSGKLTPTEGGSYTFPMTIDDQGLFFLSGPGLPQTLISSNAGGLSGTATLQAGQTYEFIYLASEDFGDATFNLNWIRPGQTTAERIPASVLTSAMNPVTQAPTIEGPVNLRPNSVGILMTAPSQNEVKFQLERATVTNGVVGPYSIVAEDVPNIDVINDTGLNPETTYSFRVRAFNFEGSAVSAPIEVTTPARQATTMATGGWYNSPFWGSNGRPAQPGVFGGPDYREEVPEILFNQPELDRPNIGIAEGGTNGRGQYSTVFTGKLIAPQTGVYNIYGFGDDDTHVWVDGQLVSADPGGHGRPPNTAAGIAQIDVRNPITLTAGQAYNFVVMHAEGGGGSELNLRWVTPAMRTADPDALPVDVPNDAFQNISDLPAAPGTGGPETVKSTSATINFADNAKSELRYLVEQSRTADFAVVERTLSAPINATSFTVTGLTPGTQYFFRIRGTNLEGEGPAIVETATTSTTPVPPNAPTNLILRTVNDRDFRLSFTDNSNDETGFVVTRRVGAGEFTEVAVLPAGSTALQDQIFPAPPRGTQVTYRVAARSAEGTSAPVEMTVLSGFPGGTGLSATAFANTTWTDDPGNPNDSISYLDPEVGENWSLGPPVAGIPEENFSVEWKGEVLAEKSEAYTFNIEGDDQISLVITDPTTGTEIVNLPLAGGSRDATPVNLVAGRRYTILMRQVETTGGASAFFRWQSPTTAREVIPEVFLFPTAGPSTPQVSEVYVKGTTWQAPDTDPATRTFTEYLEFKGLGDDVMGYRLMGTGRTPPAGNPEDIIPWINADQIVLRFTQALPGGVPTPGAFTINGLGSSYTITNVAAVPGDPTAYVLTLNKPLGGGNPATGVAPTDAENGDYVTLGVPGGGPGGGNFNFRFNVLQGDTDHLNETSATHAVLARDFAEVKKKFFKDTNSPVEGTDADYSPFHDVDGSGSILARDFAEVKKRFFQDLAAPPAAAASAPRVAGITSSMFAVRRIFSARKILG